MKNQLMIDTPPGTVFNYRRSGDCGRCRRRLPALRVRPGASEPKAQDRVVHGFSHPTFLSGPLKPGACSLPDDAVLAFDVRAFQPEWRLRNPIASGPGPHERKSAVQQAFTGVDLRQALGTCVEQLDYLHSARAVSDVHDG